MSGLEGISLGRYQLTKRLGRGGMAEVYLATDSWMHRDVAVKVVSSSHVEFVERFVREAEAIANLHHDHILPAYDYGEQELWHYLVMPYAENGTLSDLLHEGPLSLENAEELLAQIADGLQYAHDHGLIHRDIKPSNILMRDEHHIYLADFGLARVLERGSDLTQTGMLLGTPEYMAPEMADGPAGTSSDIYALAILLYQMITGRVPFLGETAISVFWKHVRDYPQPPSHFNPSIPPAVDAVLMRALEKDPELRYPTAMDLLAAYQEAISYPERVLYNAEVLQRSEEQTAFPALALSDASEADSLLRQDRLVQPGSARSLRTPRRIRRMRSPVTPLMPPPSYEREREIVTPEHMARPLRSARRVGVGRRYNNRLIGGMIIGLVFLLVVSSLIAILAIQSHQQSSLSSTSTARLDSTGSAVARSTQQIQATQQVVTASAGNATAQVQATQQAAAGTATAITSKTPLLSDSLSGPDNNGWPNDGTSCSFTNANYQIAVSSASTLQPCIAGALHYSNAAFAVQVTLTTGSDAGMVFRAKADGSEFYDFEITNNGQFYFRDRANNQYNYLFHNTTSSAIKPAGIANSLLVITQGSNFQLFINGTLVGQVQDTTLVSGQFGLVAGTLQSTSATATFSNLKVYPVS